MSAALTAFCLHLPEILPSPRIYQDDLHRLAYGTDASFYRLIPHVVVKVVNEAEVIALIDLANRYKVALTFRAAGTSLSGQAVTDSVLVVLEGNSWREHSLIDNGAKIKLEPDIIGAQANKYLAAVQRKIGPDPASIATAKIGGIAANNASGMCCGTAHNSYQTLAGMRVILADGSVLDTQDKNSREAFKQSHSTLLSDLSGLALRVKTNQKLHDKIKHKFRLKNTTGYSLNALIDFTDPIDILTHLMIGSEGTLGFIANITYNTVVDHPHKATALVLFDNLEAACLAVTALTEQPVDAVELIDRAGLKSVENQAGVPQRLKTLDTEAAALLIDLRAESAEALADKISLIQQTLTQHELIEAAEFTTDPNEYARLWAVRKGLFPAVGAVRKKGTTVIIEDVAFPIEQLAQGTRELQTLFAKYHYDEAIIFGHALAGNLHFVFTQDFSTQAEVDRYAGFMHDVSELVAVKYGGSLKAEHGTGRNMAPFVELEWGSDAYQLMWSIKQLLDPDNLLNPGVVLNRDADIHLKHLKPMPAAHDLIDSCIECGFCEPVCPSRNLTLSPRQRIVATREHARLIANQQTQAADTWAKTLNYDVRDTCAIDGLCATRCPVGINTGELVRTLHSDHKSPLATKLGQQAQQHIAGLTATTRVGLKAAHLSYKILGEKTLTTMSKGVSRISGEYIPLWHPYLPRAANKPSSPKCLTNNNQATPSSPKNLSHNQKNSSPKNSNENGKVVYFPACVTRSMGSAVNDSETQDLHQVMQRLISKAGFTALIVESVDSLCCGMPFASKGQADTANSALLELEESLWQASEQGKHPILCDTSPCTLRMIEQFTKPLKLYETAGFIDTFLLEHLQLTPKDESIALHITCSARKMGLDNTLRKLTQLCANEVIEAEEEGCCGFGGDKGFFTPELNASSLSRLKQQLPAHCTQGVSNSRTCEIGLSLHSGRQYRSIAYLVDSCC